MPGWLRKQLEKGAKVTTINRIGADGRLVRYESISNETRGILPILSQLCEQDRSLSKVYLCHPDVQHVGKLAKEGGFCGYRNIQMMVSLCLTMIRQCCFLTSSDCAQLTQTPDIFYSGQQIFGP